MTAEPDHEVIVIGGGQAGLAVAYYLRRAETDFVVLDAEDGAGGAWQHTWDSLRLFSPASYSSLPGWMMTASKSKGYPTRDEVIEYLSRYEDRYAFPIQRPCRVTAVGRLGDCLAVCDDGDRTLTARAVVSATGTWTKPYIPDYPGVHEFKGRTIHSAFYRGPEPFANKRVMIVGGGNSGAQILAELSKVADTVWVTLAVPEFLPDEVDGRVLFERATARVKGEDSGTARPGLGNIVIVPPVKGARDRGILQSVRPFSRFAEDGVFWKDGTTTPIDAVIWCTGFRPALDHLRSLGVVNKDGRVELRDQQSVEEPRLWLAGYGDWTGAASATLIGAGRTARDIVPRLLESTATQERQSRNR